MLHVLGKVSTLELKLVQMKRTATLTMFRTDQIWLVNKPVLCHVGDIQS